MGTPKRTSLLSMIIALVLSVSVISASAQCSICTKTTQQLGEKPARGMNTGILYLAFTPIAIVGVIGYRWFRSNQAQA